MYVNIFPYAYISIIAFDGVSLALTLTN